jgi:hypothetical protein
MKISTTLLLLPLPPPHALSILVGWLLQESPTASIHSCISPTLLQSHPLLPIFLLTWFIYHALGRPSGWCSTHPHLQYSFQWSVLIHSFTLSKQCQSPSPSLLLYVVSHSIIYVILSLLVFPPFPSGTASPAYSLLCCLFVHNHTSTTHNTTFLQHTPPIVISCFLSVYLIHNKLLALW